MLGGANERSREHAQEMLARGAQRGEALTSKANA
jgi:hypothetical protein